MKISKGDQANVPKNRLQNESQRVHHHQGSISAEEVKINMEKELARLPTAPELYYDGHVDNDGQFVNPKAKQVWLSWDIDFWFVDGEGKLMYAVIVNYSLLLFTHIMIDPHMRKRMVKSHGESTLRVWRLKLSNLLQKNDDQKKELDQTKQELDQAKQELGETKQGLVETQNLCRTQKVLIESKKILAETTESFMTFKQEVEKFMQANLPRS
ncbi:Leucine--tRNA ligase [Bienertia sinuspersici]